MKDVQFTSTPGVSLPPVMSLVRAEPDFSVIVPTHRRPRELEEALRSVLAQRDVSLEVLVVDDSPDGEGESVVAAVDDPRVRYLRNPVPSGGVPAQVRNLAWPLANGRFIHFLDDDDRIPEGHYAAVAAEFALRPEVGMIYGVIEPFGSNAENVAREKQYFVRAAGRARRFQRFGLRRAFAANQMFLKTVMVCSAAIVRSCCVADIGGFDPEVALCEDVDFYSRIARSYGALFIDRVVLQYRIGPSLMHRPHIEDLVSHSYRVIQKSYRARWGLLDFIVLKVLAKFAIRSN